MRSIMWWTVWGLVMAVGLVSLLEVFRNPNYLVLCIPLMAGATSAAAHRLEHEYKHALEHAKWAGVSAVFLVACVGFLYLKAHAYGPFSTATTHKAIMGTTFGMSISEVERKIGRDLREHSMETALQERAHEWLWEALPIPHSLGGENYSLPVTIFDARARVTFYFSQRELNRVELQFLPMKAEESIRVKAKLREELAKEYQLADERAEPDLTQLRYTKEAVETTVAIAPGTDRLFNIRVLMEYLPSAEPPQPPLAVQSNVF